ncbi:hypothetical protein Gasu2_62030 [Galdieria sulphuraria]|nr:hypothetical protein Gasu2_62030 [Galdieria sulphuraria]
MNSKRKRRQVCDERSIPTKYKNDIDGTSCFYLHQVKIVDSSGRLSHLLQLDRTWKGYTVSNFVYCRLFLGLFRFALGHRTPIPWQAEGGPLNDQRIAQDAAVACKLLKEILSEDHPVLLDLERLSITDGEASTEEESQINENVANTFEEAPVDPSLDIQDETVANTQVSIEPPQVNKMKDMAIERAIY